mgnify:FL=1|jgi:hypothetical protein
MTIDLNSIYRNSRKWTGKYLAQYGECKDLPKLMVSLSSKTNTYEDTVKLKNIFIKKLNNQKYYNDYELNHFTSIENNSNNSEWRNWHIHIQLHTNIPKKKIQEILNKLPNDLCEYSKLSIPKNKDIKFDYVIKDTKNLELQCYMKDNLKGKSLYSSSRKEIPDYLYKKISNHFKTKYKKDWTCIKDKYSMIKDLLEHKKIIILDNKSKQEDIDLISKNKDSLEYVSVKQKEIFFTKNIFSKSSPSKIKD